MHSLHRHIGEQQVLPAEMHTVFILVALRLAPWKGKFNDSDTVDIKVLNHVPGKSRRTVPAAY